SVSLDDAYASLGTAAAGAEAAEDGLGADRQLVDGDVGGVADGVRDGGGAFLRPSLTLLYRAAGLMIDSEKNESIASTTIVDAVRPQRPAPRPTTTAQPNRRTAQFPSG